MGMVDHSQTINVPYSVDDTYSALLQATKSIDKFEITNTDDLMHTITMKAGISWASWGEIVTASVSKCATGGSTVEVISSPKTGAMFGGANDLGKNRKNIATVFSALSNALKDYTEETNTDTSITSGVDPIEEVKKFKELFDTGIITKEEFEAKKKQLLGL